MYIMLANLALLFMVARSNLSVIASSLAVVLGSFTITAIIQAIILSGYDEVEVLPSIFTLPAILTVFLQLAVAVYIFYKLRQDEDSYIGFMGWSAIGFVSIFFVAPYLVMRLL